MRSPSQLVLFVIISLASAQCFTLGSGLSVIGGRRSNPDDLSPGTRDLIFGGSAVALGSPGVLASPPLLGFGVVYLVGTAIVYAVVASVPGPRYLHEMDS